MTCQLFLGRPFARKIPTDVDWAKFAVNCQERGIVFKSINIGAVLSGTRDEPIDLNMDPDIPKPQKRRRDSASDLFPMDSNGLPALSHVFDQMKEAGSAVLQVLGHCEAALKAHEQAQHKRLHIEDTNSLTDISQTPA